MLQRLGRTRTAKGDSARVAGPAGLGGTDGAGAAAGPAAAPARPGEVNGAPVAGAPGFPGKAGPPGGAGRSGEAGAPATAVRAARTVELPEDFDLAAHDPLRAFLLSQTGAVDVTRLELSSPALAALKKAGIVLVVPLVSSGELIGLLNLGPRLSERGYSGDDRRLLAALAGYAAPAMRVGQLVRQQQAEARDRERIELEYEEKTFQMRPGDSVLLHSDGLAEAHSADREMFGFPRVCALVGRSAPGEALIDACLAELEAFTGPGHEQEDDITLVTLERSRGAVYAEGPS